MDVDAFGFWASGRFGQPVAACQRGRDVNDGLAVGEELSHEGADRTRAGAFNRPAPASPRLAPANVPEG
jgi:hypothetical protein